MKTYNPKKPLLSIHIPKCAGSSFQAVLKKWFGNRLYSHYADERAGHPPPRHNLKSALPWRRWKPEVCVNGHFNFARGFGIEDYYAEVDQFITVLRHPFEVCLSNYWYIKQEGKDSYRNGQPHLVGELSEYIERADSHFPLFFHRDVNLYNFREYFDRKFIWIGIAEYLQECTDRLAIVLSFQKIQAPHINVSPREIDGDLSAVCNRFEARSPLAFAMYDYALELNELPPRDKGF